MTIAIPNESPRYRMVRPKVRPPTPHSRPKKKHQKSVVPGVPARTAGKWRVSRPAMIQGASIQLNTPPTSQ